MGGTGLKLTRSCETLGWRSRPPPTRAERSALLLLQLLASLAGRKGRIAELREEEAAATPSSAPNPSDLAEKVA